mmetsp:Transcript_2128/g.6306  ORF Transcript_2128/g.6306 Transcript_2128/m.6306 type:complete len:88 (+) Transcript_2128:69-332(+)
MADLDDTASMKSNASSIRSHISYSNVKPDPEAKPMREKCIACSKAEPDYMPVPCSCKVYCRACAMKVATGGKCRECKQFFVELKRFR